MAANPASQPLLSVIIPCYNYGHLVHETLDSLKLQSYSNWECIIVNDGSADNTEEVVLKYAESDPRFKYMYQENKGMSAARNNGIARAIGKYIQLLDSDDLLEKDKFKEQVSFLENAPEADIVYGHVKYFYSDSPTTYYKTVTGTQKEWMPFVSGRGEKIISSLIVGNIMAINCPIIRRSVFLRLGAFKENLKHNEDWEMFLNFAMQGVSFHYLEKENTAALVRMHSISASRDKWSMRYHELEMKEALNEQKLSLASHNFLSYELDKLRFSLLFIASSSLLHGQFAKAYHQFKLFRRKSEKTKLSRNGYRIVMDKVLTTVKSKLASTNSVEPTKSRPAL